MYYGDLLALIIATLGVGAVVYYAGDRKEMRIVTKILISVIIFLWAGFGFLWLA